MKKVNEFIALVNKMIEINDADISDDTKYELIMGSLWDEVNACSIDYEYNSYCRGDSYQEHINYLIRNLTEKRDELMKVAHLFP